MHEILCSFEQFNNIGVRESFLRVNTKHHYFKNNSPNPGWVKSL